MVLSFLVVRSRKMESISSITMSMLLMSTLVSVVTLPSEHSCSKSAFNRLTSFLTEVLSMLATQRVTTYSL